MKGKKLIILVSIALVAGLLGVLPQPKAQASTTATTYTWNQTGSASWATAANWTPARNTPAIDDVLVIDGSVTASPTLTNVPAQTIGQLKLLNNANATFTAIAAATITIGGGTGTDFDMGAGSSLTLSGSTAIQVSLSAGTTGSVLGSMTVAGGAHRLIAADASGITFNSGASFTTGTSFSGSAFGTGTANSVVFASGSTYTHNIGSNPFGLTAPSSVVVFQPGSTAVYRTTSGYSASGRTYANLTVQNSTALSGAGTGNFQFQTLTVESGSSFTHSGSSTAMVTIKGDISSAGTGSVSVASGSGGIQVNGGTTQTFGGGGGSGGITFGSALTVASGTTLAAARTLTTNGATTINGSFQLNLGGWATGSGVWTYGAAATLVFNSSGSYGVNNTDVYWPTTNGPQNITVQTGGLIMNMTRTVTGIFQTAAGVTNGNNLTLNGTTQINTGGSFSGSPTYGASSTLVYNPGGSFNISDEWNTGGTVGFGVPKNVTIQNNTAVTLPNGVLSRTVNGDLTISSGSLTIGGNVGDDLTIGGNCTSSGTFVAGTGAVTYNGASAQTVCAWTYNNLTINKSGGSTATLGGAVTVNGNLAISAGTLDTSSANNYALTLNGSFTNSGTFTANASPITIGGTVGNPSVAGFSTTGALSFTRTAGTATLTGAVTASSLTVNGTGGGLSLGTGLTHQINGAVTIAAGTLSGGSSTLGLTGNWTYDGTAFSRGTGTVTFNGSSTQTIGGSLGSLFYNLTVNNSSGVSLDQFQTVFQRVYGTLALTTGNLSLGSSILTLEGTGGGISVSGARSITGPGFGGGGVSFQGAKTISGGTLTFASDVGVALYASVNFGPSVSTINGVLSIFSGGFVNTNPPTYGPNSSLSYRSSVVHNRGVEWSTTSGPGYPSNVSITDATLNYASGNPAANSIPGGLTIDPGGTFDMGTVNSPLTVGRGVTIFGTLSLSSVPGGDLRVGGNWQYSQGAFNSNGRAVIFNGTSTQSIFGSVSTTFADLTINNSVGVSLFTSQTVNGTLTLTSGRLSLGASNLIIASNNAVAGGPFSASQMIVADGSGALCKQYTSIGSFQFPIGDASGPSNTPEYSPVTLNFTGGSFAGNAQACVRVTDAVYSPIPANRASWLTRYWTVTSTNITSFSCNVSFNYVQSDVNVVPPATESSISYQHSSNSGATWTQGAPTDATNNILSGTVTGFSVHTGFSQLPTAVTLADFGAVQQGDAVLLTWETNSELNNRGFNLYRGTSDAGPDRQLNETLIPSQSQGNPGGFVYTWEDRADLVPGTSYFYWVEDVDIYGTATMHGPVSVDFTVPTAVTLSSIQASPAAAGPVAPLAGTLLALLAPLAGALAVRWRRRA